MKNKNMGDGIIIPFSRMPVILRKGDLVRGECYKYKFPKNHFYDYANYKITHIAWWGIMAVPTDTLLYNYSKDFGNLPDNPTEHIKFKWENITGLWFKGVKNQKKKMIKEAKEAKKRGQVN